MCFDISAAGDIPGVFEDELVLMFDGEGGGNMKTVVFPLVITLSGSSLQFDDTVVGMQVCAVPLAHAVSAMCSSPVWLAAHWPTTCAKLW